MTSLAWPVRVILPLAVAVAACGPGHESARISPSVELEYPFPKTSPDRLWEAVNGTMEDRGWPVDSASTADRTLVSGWMEAPEGSTDCGSYDEVPDEVDAFQDKEYRLRVSVLTDGAGGRVRILSDHRATGWYGEAVDDCVTTGQIQAEVRSGIIRALRSGTPDLP